MAPSGHTSEKRTVHSKITKKFKTESGQLVFHHGHGGEVQATDGTTYLDFVMGYGPVVLGHNTTSFTRAVAESLTNGVMMPGYTSFHEEYLDRLLADQPGRRGAFSRPPPRLSLPHCVSLRSKRSGVASSAAVSSDGTTRRSPTR